IPTGGADGKRALRAGRARMVAMGNKSIVSGILSDSRFFRPLEPYVHRTDIVRASDISTRRFSTEQGYTGSISRLLKIKLLAVLMTGNARNGRDVDELCLSVSRIFNMKDGIKIRSKRETAYKAYVVLIVPPESWVVIPNYNTTPKLKLANLILILIKLGVQDVIDHDMNIRNSTPEDEDPKIDFSLVRASAI
ncbi:3843_t:CDS:2, partial [Acaulospora colombiana]